MVFELIKRDLTWRGEVVMWMLVFGYGLVLFAGTFAGSGVLGFQATLLSFIVLQQNLHRRATLFEVALPVSGRQLFLSRVLSNLLVAALGCAALAGTLLVQPKLDSTALVQVLQGCAVFTLALLLPLSVRPQELAVSKRLLIALRLAVAAAGGAAWYWLPPAVMLALFAAAIIATALTGWISVPAALQVAPVEATGHATPARITQTSPPGRAVWSRWQLWSAGFTWQTLFLFVFSLWPAFAIAGLYVLVLFLLLGTNLTRQKTAWLQALPVSHRTLLAITLAGTLLPLLAGMAIGNSLPLAAGWSPLESVSNGPPRTSAANWPGTNVPLEFWRYAPGGAIPEIRAPWGESIQPDSLTIVGFNFYNPYTARQGVSPQFFNWQFERATKTVHGMSVPQERYGEALKAGLPLVTRRAPVRILLFAMILVAGLYVVCYMELVRWHRLWRPVASQWRFIVIVLFGLPVFAPFALEWHSIMQSTGPLLPPLFNALAVRLAAILPDHVPVVAAAAAMPVLAMYALLEWQFRQSEIRPTVQRTAGWNS